jgi:hypothetical protein
MKTGFIALAVCLAISFCQAQPVITSSTSPQVGDVATGTLADTTGWNPGPAGANVTWDFTGLVAIGSGTVAWVAVAGTPYAASYPNANLVMAQSSATGSSYSYFNSTSDHYDNIGVGNDNIVVTMPNPQTVITYPFTYLDSLTDTAKGTYTAPMSITGHRTIYSTTVADGYGTLKLPGGVTYNNVLRIKIVSQAYDSVFYMGSLISRPEKDYTEYDWTVPGIRPWVHNMQRVLSVASGIVTKSIMYTSPATSAVYSKQETGQIVPQKATVSFSCHTITVVVPDNIELAGNAVLSLYTTAGTLARRFDHLSGHFIQINNLKIASGVYFCRLTVGNSIITSNKLVIY